MQLSVFSNILIFKYVCFPAVGPSDFTEFGNTQLVEWRNYRLNATGTQTLEVTFDSCVNMCLTDQNCVSFEFEQFYEQDYGDCNIPSQSDPTPGCSSDDGDLLVFSCSVCEYQLTHYKIRERCCKYYLYIIIHTCLFLFLFTTRRK